ncbi:hypothetical protein VTI74DRAFT_253 [Chaetomium olivicolor]
MDRDPNSATNLLERKNILIAQVMTAFRDLVNNAAAPVDSTASTGQAAYSSLAIETGMTSIVKSTEDLLTLTRQLRELWIVGPLKAPDGAQDAEAEQCMRQDAAQVFAILNALRDAQRAEMVGRANEAASGGFTYQKGEVDGASALSQTVPAAQEVLQGPSSGAGVQLQAAAAGPAGQHN